MGNKEKGREVFETGKERKLPDARGSVADELEISAGEWVTYLNLITNTG